MFTEIKAISHALADDNSRPCLTFPHVDAENKRMWAADGFRLAVVDLPDAYLKMPIDYTSLIPKTFRVTIVIHMNELLNVMRVVKSVAGSVRIHAIDLKHKKCHFSYLPKDPTNDGLNVDMGVDCIDVYRTGKRVGKTKDIKACINAKYVWDCLSSMKKLGYNQVAIQINNEASPVYFSGAGYQEVIMPMFIKD